MLALRPQASVGSLCKIVQIVVRHGHFTARQADPNSYTCTRPFIQTLLAEVLLVASPASLKTPS